MNYQKNRWFEKGAILAVLAASVQFNVASADPISPGGDCPKGYSGIVTEPADVPAGYTGDVVEYVLPKNVCVRKLPDHSRMMTENFSSADFIPIDGVALHPFAGVEFQADRYEPILGHFSHGNSYAQSVDPQGTTQGDFSGAHPVLVSRSAKAALRFKNGVYLFDKQISVFGMAVAKCSEGYSTVGDSATCYSKKNQLKLNAHNQLELTELEPFVPRQKGQECPLGYAQAWGLGSERGICAPIQLLRGPSENTGLWSQGNPFDGFACPGGEYSRNDTFCLPQITAVHCHMDGKPQSSRRASYAFYWPTEMVTRAAALIELEEHYSSVTTGSVTIAALHQGFSRFDHDDAFVSLSGSSRGRLPVLNLYSGKSCEVLKDTVGYSLEPLPSGW